MVVHITAVIIACRLPLLLAITIIAGIACSAVLWLRRPWPHRLRATAEGLWWIEYSDGRVLRSRVIGHVRSGPILTSITFMAPRRRTLLLAADTFRDGDHSALGRLLRNSHNHRSC